MIKGTLGGNTPVNISKVFLNNIAFTKITYGLLILWLTFRSCFSSGVWKSEYLWLNEENWKN